jgi:hypothetical protein
VNRAKANQPSIRSGSIYRNCFPNHFLSICAKYFIAGLLSAGGVVPMARAQISTAAVVGTMTDASGAALAGVKVTATNADTGLAYNGETNTSGEFVIPALPPGRYKIQGVLAGFKTWQIPQVTLAVGDRFRADSKMEVGQIQQSVEVHADAAGLQTESATVGSVVNRQEVQDLPINGRNFFQLTQIVPGATDYAGGSFANNTLDDRRRSTTVSVNGRTGAENNFTIDGMDNNEKFIGTILVKPSMEALAEMKVLTNSFSAETSRTGGAAIAIITKGGTNELHGSAFEYLRNEVLDARPPNLAATAAKPPYKQHNFGGSIGGPIRKNKAFFFGDWETYKSALGAVMLSTIPTPAMTRGDFSAPGLPTIYDVSTTRTVNGVTTRQAFPGNIIPSNRFNPIGATLASLYPVPINSSTTNNYQQNGTTSQTDNTMDTRLDYRFSDANSFFARYSYDRSNTAAPGSLPPKNGFDPIGNADLPSVGSASSNRLSVHGLAFNDTHTLSPAAVLVLRAGYSRYANQSLPLGYGTAPATKLGIPNVNVDADSSGFPTVTATNYAAFGDGQYIPDLNFQNIFTTSGSLQLQKGSHALKFGGEFTRRQVNMYQSSQPRIAFAFTPTFTSDPSRNFAGGDAIASLLLGYPQTTTRNRYLIHPGYRYAETGWFFQDDWRVNKWLTLNLGARWDYYSPLSEAYGRIANFDFTTLKLIFPDQNGVNNVVNVQKDWRDFSPRFGFAAQAGRKTVIRGGFGINYMSGLQGTPGSFRNPPYISTLSITPTNLTPINSLSDPIPPLNPVDPVNLSGPLAAVAQGYRAPYVEQFNFTVQRQLAGRIMLTTGYVASLGKRQSGSNTTIDRNGAPPGAANVQTRRVYSSIYPNVTTINTVQNYYTSSYNALQTSLDIREWRGITLNVNHTWAHALDNSELRYIGYAQPVTIKGSANSDIRHRVAITMVYDLPFGNGSKSLYSLLVRNWRLNALGIAQTGLPFQVTQTGTQTNNATGTNRPNQVADFRVASGTTDQWFNQAAFLAQPANTWGNEGRNLLNAPGKWNFDLSVHREFRPTERMTLQFRWEAFDFTNTVTPAGPVSVLGAPGFGRILTFTGNRQQQIALKVLF